MRRSGKRWRISTSTGSRTELHNFCAVDLSAFYFDIRKDALYCDAPESLRRRAARTVLAELFSFLTAWLAPITCFTAEEAWLARPQDMPDGGKDSVHLRTYPEIPAAWLDAALGEKWKTVRALRRVVTGALELERAEKRIGSSLQAAPRVHAAPEYLEAFAGPRPLRDLHHLGQRAGRGQGPEPAPSPCPTWRASPSSRCRRTATNAHAAGRYWKRSASRRSIRCSAGAARRR